MIQSINFPLSDYCVAPYGGWDKLAARVHALGLDGVEGIVDPIERDDTFPKELLSGYHLVYYPDWLDFYRQNIPALLRKYGNWEAVETMFGGREPEAMIRGFKKDLEFALSMGTPYVVFHVSNSSLEETYTFRFLHTNREVLDNAIEVINEVLKDVPPTFDFLVENLWWPGFTFQDPAETEYLLSGIRYPRKGIMLDTGHLMNTNRDLRTQWDGIRYIQRLYRAHGELGKSVLGLHFHQSLSARYVRSNTGKLPDDYPEEYFKAFSRTYAHVGQIDRHRPWTDPRCVQLLDEIKPLYLTHELSYSPKRPLLASARTQLNTIKKGFENR